MDYYVINSFDATGNGVASIQLQRNGRIKQVRFMTSLLPAANDDGYMLVQLATQPVLQSVTEVASAINNTIIAEQILSVRRIDTATQATLHIEPANLIVDVDFPVQALAIVSMNILAPGQWDGSAFNRIAFILA